MQKGISGILILIGFAVVLGIAALFLLFFSGAKNPLNQGVKQTVELPPQDLIPPPNTKPGCSDTDYTGCDNTAQWMTWDGNIPGENSEVRTDSTGTIYSK